TARLDLADPASIGPGCGAIQAWCDGRLDAVVNNAGSSWPGPIELLPLDELRLQFEVNVFGHVDVTQRLLPALRAARGRALFISSDSVTITPPMVGAYAASKRAIEAIAEALAQEVADQGVQVIVVAPGPYQTAIWGTSMPRGESVVGSSDPRAELYRPLAERIAATVTNRPLGDPADLAAVVLRALDAQRPAFRYVAPFSSHVGGWIKAILGHRAFHRVVRAVIDRGA
ncbi:MAG TPA: SDR family NAD(P)-dependent oxidoreductase, partial [Myxococcota bacterium]|nr:SDR family NAD(P)-dependent oxidoreductase [Myxococcota bacterium]